MRAATVDHVKPVTLGGESTWENLVTACQACNTGKSNYTLDELGWRLDGPARPGWDGLTGSYQKLWELSGKRNERLHRDWMRQLARARDYWEGAREGHN